MYDVTKFKFVEVLIEKGDCLKEQLVEDLRDWSSHLYLVDDKNKEFIKFRGLLPIREVKDLELLKAMSPYGAGYKLVIDGRSYI